MRVEFWVIIGWYCSMELVKFGRRTYEDTILMMQWSLSALGGVVGIDESRLLKAVMYYGFFVRYIAGEISAMELE